MTTSARIVLTPIYRRGGTHGIRSSMLRRPARTPPTARRAAASHDQPGRRSWPSPETRSSSTRGSTGSGCGPAGGLSDTRRITYEAAAGEHVVIKGSERVTGWERGRAGTRVARRRAERALRLLQPLRRGDRRRLDRLPERGLADASTSATSTSTGAASTRSAARPRSSDPPLRTEVHRRLDRATGPGPRPGADAHTSGTPRSAPTRRPSGRTSRAPTRTRSWSRSTCGGRSSTPPSTTSTTSPSAASSCARPPARGPRPPRTSRA